MLAIALETERSEAARFSSEFGVAFPILFDPRGQAAAAYGVQMIPHNVLVDRRGAIARVITGLNIAEIERAVREAVRD